MNRVTRFIKKIVHHPVNSVSLVLSGGGARGAIHLGVLQALDEYNIKVEAIAGTSIGSIIGAFYSAGITPLQMKKIMESRGFIKMFHFSWNKKGLLTMKDLYRMFEKYHPDKSFSSLNIPFYSCASNLDTNRCEIFHDGDLHKAVAASASIPVLFQPVEMNGCHYIDGGLYNNFPVEPLLKKHSNILGIHINNNKQPDEYNVFAIAERIFTAVVQQNVVRKMNKCDFLINPFLEKRYGIIDFRNTEELFEIGYKEGVDFVKRTR